MKVKIKRNHSEAKIPTYAREGDAAMDLHAVSRKWDNHGNVVYDTGVSIEIPRGYAGLVFPRSSVSKTCLQLRNAVGIIDSGYRGNIILKFGQSLHHHANPYDAGDRIGQIMIIPYPQIEIVEVEELTDTVRGTGGFGSTGER